MLIPFGKKFIPNHSRGHSSSDQTTIKQLILDLEWFSAPLIFYFVLLIFNLGLACLSTRVAKATDDYLGRALSSIAMSRTVVRLLTLDMSDRPQVILQLLVADLGDEN